MVGNNLNDVQLQQLVDRTIVQTDKTFSGKISYEDFKEQIMNLNIGQKLNINYEEY